MAEWLKAAVLKTAFRYPRNGGSNPPPSETSPGALTNSPLISKGGRGDKT